jgi:hypothetical protein
MKALAGAFLIAGLLAGCNIFEGAFSEATDAEVLLADARHARASGDLDKAIGLLEKALVVSPSHPIVRFELASTLMRRDKLDLLTLEATVSHLLNAGGTASARSAPDQVCTFGLLDSAEPFDPTDFEAFEQISASRPTILRVLELLNDPSSPTETPAMPSELTDLDICEVMSPNGLEYNRSVVLSALSDRFENHSQVTGALTANSIAITLGSYVNLFEQPDLNVDWYIVNGQNVGACVADENIELLTERARGEVRRAGQALISLDLLIHHSGNTNFEEVIDDAIDFYQTLESDDIDPCSD